MNSKGTDAALALCVGREGGAAPHVGPFVFLAREEAEVLEAVKRASCSCRGQKKIAKEKEVRGGKRKKGKNESNRSGKIHS